jgi:SAM-dependent methyltransferase
MNINPAFTDNAQLFDLLFAKPRAEKQRVKGLSDALKKFSIQSALYVGSGGGEFAIELARNGFDATGVDYSPEMIAIAKGKPDSQLVDWINDDVFQYAKTMPRFDCILAVYSFYQTLRKETERLKLLEVFRRSCTFGVIEIQNDEVTKKLHKYGERKTWYPDGYKVEAVSHETGPTSYTLHFSIYNSEHQSPIAELEHRVTCMSASGLADDLHGAGLRPVLWLDSEDVTKEFNSEKSPGMFCVFGV